MNAKPVIQVAYADDHQMVRKAIIGFLNASGEFRVVIEASNGKELVRSIENASVLPDVCMVDINMPEMNGFDTVKSLKNRWPYIKILVVSVFENERYMIRMIVNGANGYITKSCSTEELFDAIRVLSKNENYYSGRFSVPFVNAVRHGQISLPNITDSELELLKLCCTDLSYSEIAQKLGVTSRSIEGHRDSLFKKLHVQSRTGLALYAVQTGIVPLELNHTGNLKSSRI